MIETVTAYKLTCQGCGTERVVYPEPASSGLPRDIRAFVNALGWWCADSAQSIDSRVVWHIRCEACGEPTGPAEEPPTTQIIDLFEALKGSLR